MSARAARRFVPRLDRRRPLVPDVPDELSVKLIGLGGVGGIVARYGALFIASLERPARLVLIDGDAFEPKNAARMLFRGAGNKARLVRDDLVDHFDDSLLSITAIEEFVTPDNSDRLLHDGDIVLLAVDNHATRKLVSDLCAERLANVCLISGGNDGVGIDGVGADGASGMIVRGTYGNCQIYVRQDGADATPSLSARHPEIANPTDALPTDLHCTDLIASTPQILFANLMAAASILNALWLFLCGGLHYSEICFDVADGLMRPVAGVSAPVETSL